jgi:hypothetical protein
VDAGEALAMPELSAAAVTALVVGGLAHAAFVRRGAWIRARVVVPRSAAVGPRR